MIRVNVYVGIGAWTAHAKVDLVACPHVGDWIDVNGVTVTCEKVTIGRTDVTVHETIRFTSEEQAKAYFRE